MGLQRRLRGAGLVIMGLLCLANLTLGQSKTAPDFQQDIKPILDRHCTVCHSTATKTSGLIVESIDDLLKGGLTSGAAIIPGNSTESPLIQFVRGEKKPAMPMGQDPLPAEEISLLARWIDGVKVSPKDAGARKQYPWPFAKLERPTEPQVNKREWVRNPIDAFVLKKLEDKGIEPAPPASKRALLRRVYFDLIGLPPTPEDMNRFLQDSSPDAYEREIDRLLDDSRYGERWGRHWLDVVRYADSGGGGLDYPLPHMWRYRDYVIRAFNQDRPYDRFIKEQIAGDAFPGYGAEGKIGLGFLRLGVFLEGTPQEMRHDLLTDIVGSTGSAFLGLTVACARCHDHKFDPIPTRDYYRMEAFFAPVTVRPEPVPFTQYERGTEWEKKDKEWAEVLEKRKEERERVVKGFQERVEKALAFSLSSPQDLKDLSVPIGGGELARAMAAGVLFTKEEKELYGRLNRQEIPGPGNIPDRYKPMAYTATELLGADNSPGPNYPFIPATYVLKGGNLKLRGEAVQPGFLSAAVGEDSSANLEGVNHVRRKSLAQWISSADNPLTPRVMVNRIWQHHFGIGLVPTPSDFGKNGGGTVHQELIDWLASEFIGRGWSIKAMHRLMLQSSVYRQSMVNPKAEAYEKVDPERRYLWQMNVLRLEAEAVRDAILAVSGELNSAMGGPGIFPSVNEELMKKAAVWWEPSSKEEQNRRSIYMLQQRALVAPLINVFDGANLNESCAVRGLTTVTPQVFALFNSAFVNEKSQAMAARIIGEVGNDPVKQIEKAYALALQRAPSEAEKAKSLAFSSAGRLSELCLVILNLNELIFLE